MACPPFPVRRDAPVVTGAVEKICKMMFHAVGTSQFRSSRMVACNNSAQKGMGPPGPRIQCGARRMLEIGFELQSGNPLAAVRDCLVRVGSDELEDPLLCQT